MNVQIPDNNANSKKNAFFDLITNLIFYIPCLFSGTIDSVLGSGVQTVDQVILQERKVHS